MLAEDKSTEKLGKVTEVLSLSRAREIRREQKKERFLTELRENGGYVALAAKALATPTKTFYEWRKLDAQFAHDWDQVIEQGIDELEREARRRAYKGVLEPVFQQGKKVGKIRRYSDRLMEVLLRGNRPEKYREQYFPKNAVQDERERIAEKERIVDRICAQVLDKTEKPAS